MERNGFVPSVYGTVQAQKNPPPRQESAPWLGPAQAHPFILLSCTEDGTGRDNTGKQRHQRLCLCFPRCARFPGRAAGHQQLLLSVLGCPAEKPRPHRCPSAELPRDITRHRVPSPWAGDGARGQFQALPPPPCSRRMQLSPLQPHLPMAHPGLSPSGQCSCRAHTHPHGPFAAGAAFSNLSGAQLREDKHRNPCMLPRGEREAKQRDKGEFQVNIKKLFTLRKWYINNHSVYKHLPLDKTQIFLF